VKGPKEKRISDFIAGKLRGHHSNYLLLGVHGVGKSQFLLELGRYIAYCGGSSYTFFYLSIDLQNIPRSIVDLVAGALEGHRSIPSEIKTVDGLHDWLHEQKLFVG
jgi:predicted AAA+ superfamily ATPase